MQPVDRAGRVVRMQRREHEVAGQGRLDRDLGGLEVSDLTDHDDVRILPQEGAQGGREVEPDLLVHLDLVDAGQVEFDRVLGGDDVDLRALLSSVRARVQRRRLSRPGGAGDQDHPVGLVDRFLEMLQALRLETELGHVEHQIVFVEQAHHDLLAVERRQRRDAEVELLDLALELHLSLMRPSCGRRFSAMSSLARILMREQIASLNLIGGFMIS